MNNVTDEQYKEYIFKNMSLHVEDELKACKDEAPADYDFVKKHYDSLKDVMHRWSVSK